jgi:hypothetical protein
MKNKSKTKKTNNKINKNINFLLYKIRYLFLLPLFVGIIFIIFACWVYNISPNASNRLPEILLLVLGGFFIGFYIYVFINNRLKNHK